MSRSCSNCGTQLNEGTKFCPGCGAAQNAAPAPAEQNATQYVEPACAGNGAVRQGVPAPGFSDRVNHPEIIAAVKKSRKATMIGGIKSAVFLVFALCSFIKLESADIIGAALSS